MEVARERLDVGTRNVQEELDRVLQPAEGVTIGSWGWFFWAYGALLLGLGAGAYYWDTSRRFRGAAGKVLWFADRPGAGVIEGSGGGYFRRQWRGGFLCALPWILGFVVLSGGPMLFSLVMSFCDFDVLNPAKFVGWRNYGWLAGGDDLVGTALWNTLFMLLGVPMGMAVSLGMALLLNLQVRWMAAWRTFFYLPAIMPIVAASVLWIWMFNPEGGLINRVLEGLGVSGPNWLSDAQWSKPALILMGLWSAGGGMIIWLAGLKGISPSLYEAARVDGASRWRQLWHVTIPQLTPYIFFNLILGIIATLQIFSQAFIMTRGGPANSTLFYVYHLFNHAFRYGKMGYASALAWVLFVIIFLLTVVQLKLSKRWVYYEKD